MFEDNYTQNQGTVLIFTIMYLLQIQTMKQNGDILHCVLELTFCFLLLLCTFSIDDLLYEQGRSQHGARGGAIAPPPNLGRCPPPQSGLAPVTVHGVRSL